MQVHMRRFFKSAEKNSHQWSVIKDPSDPAVTSILQGQIISDKQHPTIRRKIAKVELFEGHQIIQEIIPKAQALHEPPAGVGNGVGTATSR
jgi:hypothetical protein